MNVKLKNLAENEENGLSLAVTIDSKKFFEKILKKFFEDFYSYFKFYPNKKFVNIVNGSLAVDLSFADKESRDKIEEFVKGWFNGAKDSYSLQDSVINSW